MDECIYPEHPSPDNTTCEASADLDRLADDGGPNHGGLSTSGFETARLPADDISVSPRRAPVGPFDPHSHDYHVYIDGALRQVVPCGVCEQRGDAAYRDLAAKYGTPLHDDIREQVRAHIEAYARAAHPANVVSVK